MRSCLQRGKRSMVACRKWMLMVMLVMLNVAVSGSWGSGIRVLE